MISQLLIQMVKYAFGFPVVAMVSHIPVKSRMAVNYVTMRKLRPVTGEKLHIANKGDFSVVYEN